MIILKIYSLKGQEHDFRTDFKWYGCIDLN